MSALDVVQARVVQAAAVLAAVRRDVDEPGGMSLRQETLSSGLWAAQELVDQAAAALKELDRERAQLAEQITAARRRAGIDREQG